MRTQQSSPGPGNYGVMEPSVRSVLRHTTGRNMNNSMTMNSGDTINQSIAVEDSKLRPNSGEKEAFNDSIISSAHPHNTSRFSNTALTTKRNTTMAKVGKSLTSTIQNDRGFSFGGAMDRFRAPTQKFQSPPPNTYRISDSIGYENERAPFKTSKMITPHFVKDSRLGIDLLLKLKVDRDPSPGPGSYSHYSEFNNTRKHQASIIKKKSPRHKSERY